MIQYKGGVWDEIGQAEYTRRIGEPAILFNKIDDDVIKVQVERLKKEMIDLEYFSKVSLKSAKVLTAERVKGSKNLIKCQVQVGDQKKQIVAGVGKDYEPEDLLDKIIIIVDNLQPAKIRGVVSEGMLLAAVDEKGVVIITADREISSGTQVR